MAERRVYQITASNGAVFQVEAETDEQAQKLGQWIDTRIAAGDVNLEDTTDAPFSVNVAAPPKTPGLDYKEVDGEQQVDRGGFIGGLDALIRGAADGATFNFADEIASGANALLPLDALTGKPVKSVWGGNSFWDAFEHNQNIENQITEADQAQNPILRSSGEIGGVVAQTLLGARALGAVAPGATNAVKAASVTAPLRTSAAVGTGTGTLQGGLAGLGQGDDLEERAKNAKIGATFGGITGGVAAPVLTTLAPAIAKYGKVLYGTGSEEEATAQLITALKRDGYDVTSPTGVKTLKDELSNYLGKPVSLADIGNATRARAGVGLRAPSEVQSQGIDTVLQRQAGQGARLASDIRGTVAPRTDVHALDEALIAEREAAAMPLRDQALFTQGPGFGTPATAPRAPLAQPTGLAPEVADTNGFAIGNGADAGLRRMLGLNVPDAPPTFVPTVPNAPNAIASLGREARIPTDPTLQQLARLPLAQRALTQSRALAQDEVGLKSVLGQDISHLPDQVPGTDLDMRSFDYLKRFLDAEVNKLARGADTSSFKAAEYGQVKELRNAIRERMREVVPEYGDYLDAYRGSSEMIDALADGRTFRQLDPEQIAAKQAKRSQAGQELYRVGAARDLMDTLGSTRDGANPATRILNSNESREQLAATGVSPENAALLNRSVDIERQLNKLPAELAGSQTAQRAAAMTDADAGLHATLPFNPGSPFGWLGAGARTVLNRASTTRNAAVNEALLPKMLETDPAAIFKHIGVLEAAGRKAEADQIRRALGAFKFTGALGGLIGTNAAINTGDY
jgi:hypothetical protein